MIGEVYDREREDIEMPHDEDAPFAINQVVYLKSVVGDNYIPTGMINKPMRVTKCWRVPLNEGEPPTWDVTAEDPETCEEFELITLHTDWATEKPFP